MSRILEAEYILYVAQSCVECIFLAASDIGEEPTPIQTVADIASTKISEAITLLNEYRQSAEASPVPAAPDAKPVSPAAQTKRRGK